MARGTVNKVILLGRLGQDPDVRATASGTQVINLNVATNELGPKNHDGTRGDDVTEWHRIVLFGRMAENAATYLRKGSQVYIEGRLNTRKWQDQDGRDRYMTQIVGHEMQFVGGSQNAQGGQQGGPGTSAHGGFGSPQGGTASQPHTPPADNFDDFDDDIPF